MQGRVPRGGDRLARGGARLDLQPERGRPPRDPRRLPGLALPRPRRPRLRLLRHLGLLARQHRQRRRRALARRRRPRHVRSRAPRSRPTLLTSPAMLAPHESLNLNRRRGLLAAEVGNGLTLPGTIAIYDVGSDCRAPAAAVLDADRDRPRERLQPATARPSGSPAAAGYIKAVDVTDPAAPRSSGAAPTTRTGSRSRPTAGRCTRPTRSTATSGSSTSAQVQDRAPRPEGPRAQPPHLGPGLDPAEQSAS